MEANNFEIRVKKIVYVYVIVYVKTDFFVKLN